MQLACFEDFDLLQPDTIRLDWGLWFIFPLFLPTQHYTVALATALPLTRCGWLAMVSCFCRPAAGLLTSRSDTDTDLLFLQHKAAKRLPETTDARAAQLLLDKLCALYYDKKAKYTDSQRYEKLRYDMLIAAIDGALPEHSSAMVRKHLTLFSE